MEIVGKSYQTTEIHCSRRKLVLYSGFISREKILGNFANLSQFAKILFANIACAPYPLALGVCG